MVRLLLAAGFLAAAVVAAAGQQECTPAPSTDPTSLAARTALCGGPPRPDGDGVRATLPASLCVANDTTITINGGWVRIAAPTAAHFALLNAGEIHVRPYFYLPPAISIFR